MFWFLSLYLGYQLHSLLKEHKPPTCHTRIEKDYIHAKSGIVIISSSSFQSMPLTSESGKMSHIDTILNISMPSRDRDESLSNMKDQTFKFYSSYHEAGKRTNRWRLSLWEGAIYD